MLNLCHCAVRHTPLRRRAADAGRNKSARTLWTHGHGVLGQAPGTAIPAVRMAAVLTAETVSQLVWARAVRAALRFRAEPVVVAISMEREARGGGDVPFTAGGVDACAHGQ